MTFLAGQGDPKLTILDMLSRVSALLTLAFTAGLLFAQAPPSPPDFSQEAYVFEHLNQSVRLKMMVAVCVT